MTKILMTAKGNLLANPRADAGPGPVMPPVPAPHVVVTPAAAPAREHLHGMEHVLHLIDLAGEMLEQAEREGEHVIEGDIEDVEEEEGSSRAPKSKAEPVVADVPPPGSSSGELSNPVLVTAPVAGKVVATSVGKGAVIAPARVAAAKGGLRLLLKKALLG